MSYNLTVHRKEAFMDRSASSMPATNMLRLDQSSPLFAALLLLSSLLAAFVPSAAAQGTTVTLGSGTLDRDQTDGPRRTRVNFDPLISGTHTIRVAWDSDADIRFSIFQLIDAPKPDDRAMIGTTNNIATPGEWTGTLDVSEQYFLSIWSVAESGNFSATIEADTIEATPLEFVTQPVDLTVTEGDDAIFTVVASGGGDLSYQWFVDGGPISGETTDSLTVVAASLVEDGTEYAVEVSDGLDTVTSNVATLTVNEPLALGLFSQEADASAWVLEGPARTLDYKSGANTDGWGRALLRIGNVLLVGGDFEGIKPRRSGPVTNRPFLAAFNAVSGQPVSTFQVPQQVSGVVRSLVLSPDRRQVYVGGDFGLLALDATTGELEMSVSVTGGGGNEGRVFDVAATDSHLYIGGDFSRVGNESRSNIARLSLDGELDPSWRPKVTFGFSAGRSAPVQSLAISPSGNTVYVGGNFQRINGVPVANDAAEQEGVHAFAQRGRRDRPAGAVRAEYRQATRRV